MNFIDSLWSQAQLAPAYRAVILFVMGLGVIAFAFCVVLVVHHGVTSGQRRRRTSLVNRATPHLATHVATGEKLPEAIAESRQRFGDWATAIVLREARGEVRGERAAQLTQALVDMGEVSRLGKLAASRQDWRRAHALRELGQCGGDEARAILLKAIEDPSPEVRRSARDGLLLDGRPASVKAAMTSYRQDLPVGTTWRRSFYARLAAVAPDDLRELLAAGTLDRSEEKMALEALGEAKVAAVLPVARQRLADADPEIRATAARVVGKLGDAQSVPALTKLLSDPEWYVRAAAAKAFDSMHVDEATTRALTRSLSDETWWVRVNAAHALAQQGNGGVEALLAAAEGQDAYSRDAGLAALGHAMMAPAARKRMEGALSRLPDDSPAAPLRRLLESVPSGPRHVLPGGVRP